MVFLEIRKPPTMRLDAEVKKFFFSWLEMKYVAGKIWIKTNYFLKRTQSYLFTTTLQGS